MKTTNRQPLGVLAGTLARRNTTFGLANLTAQCRQSPNADIVTENGYTPSTIAEAALRRKIDDHLDAHPLTLQGLAQLVIFDDWDTINKCTIPAWIFTYVRSDAALSRLLNLMEIKLGTRRYDQIIEEIFHKDDDTTPPIYQLYAQACEVLGVEPNGI